MSEPLRQPSDPLGVDPDFTGDACSACYVRWQRRDIDDLHPACEDALLDLLRG